jgi:hypothetical protein
MSQFVTRIRAGTSADMAALVKLGPRRPGKALVAEVDDAVIAAIDLTSGAIVADPSRSTPHTVHALRRGRYELLRQGGAVRHARFAIARAANRLAPSPVTQF